MRTLSRQSRRQRGRVMCDGRRFHTESLFESKYARSHVGFSALTSIYPIRPPHVTPVPAAKPRVSRTRGKRLELALGRGYRTSCKARNHRVRLPISETPHSKNARSSSFL